MAAAGEAEMFAHGLADDFAAGVENARDDGGVKFRCVAFQYRGAIHHRHARNTDIILDSDALPGQRPTWRALDRTFLVPCIQRILLWLWAIATSTWVFDRQSRFRQLVDATIGLKCTAHQAEKRVEVGIAHVHAIALGDGAQLLDCGLFWHDLLLSLYVKRKPGPLS